MANAKITRVFAAVIEIVLRPIDAIEKVKAVLGMLDETFKTFHMSQCYLVSQ